MSRHRRSPPKRRILDHDGRARTPLLEAEHDASPSIFTPESLLREARRQKGAPLAPVPAVCLLDPDGDVVRRLRAEGRSRRHPGWVCDHTELDVFTLDGREVGVVGCAVGAAFAVLVAEELFASGCKLLSSVTSAGQLVDLRPPPYFVAIDRALRDEGTSHHDRPPAATVAAPATAASGAVHRVPSVAGHGSRAAVAATVHPLAATGASGFGDACAPPGRAPPTAAGNRATTT